jgi:hypothetical protein
MDLTVLYLAVPSLTADLEPSSTELLWITDIYGFMLAGFRCSANDEHRRKAPSGVAGKAGHATSLEDGASDLAGHLPVDHVPPLARRTADRNLALGVAHTGHHGRAGAAHGLPVAASRPASARVVAPGTSSEQRAQQGT